MSETDKKPQGRPRSVQSHQAILQATLAMLAEVGYDRMSIDAIASRAGVGKTTIYRWWPNKTAVVMDALASQPAMQTPMPTAKNNAQAMVFQLEKLIRLLQSKNGETIAQLFSEAQGSAESHKIFENNFLGPLIDAIEFSIEQGKKDGEFRADLNTKIAVDIICGPIFFRLMAHPADFNEKFQQTWPQEAVRLIGA